MPVTFHLGYSIATFAFTVRGQIRWTWKRHTFLSEPLYFNLYLQKMNMSLYVPFVHQLWIVCVVLILIPLNVLFLHIYVLIQRLEFEDVLALLDFILLRFNSNNMFTWKGNWWHWNIRFSDSSWETQWSRCTQILSAAYWWCWFLSQERSLPSRLKGEHWIEKMIEYAFHDFWDC